MGFLSNEWKLGLQEGYVDLRLRGHFNQVVPLSKYKGHVCVIVNVASKCGLTATNYKELNELYDKYSESHGLRILAFPCNQFSGQEPGSSDDICSFAILLYLIDSALLRPGRFDKLLYVGIYADKESKLSVLKAITRKFSLENWDILERIAAELPDNVTGADLQAVCSNAWLNAAKRVIRKWESEARDGETRGKLAETVEVVEADFVEAVGGLVPSVSQEELRKYEQLHGELTSKKREMKIQLKDAVNELGGEKGVDQVVTSWRDWRKRVVNRFRENSSRIFSDQDQRLLSLLQKHRALIPAPVSDPTAIRLSGSKQVNQHSSIGSLGSNTNLTSQGIKIPANSAKGTLQKPSIQNLAVFSAGSSSRKSVPQSQLSSQFPHPTSTITCPAQMNESQKNGQPPINTGSIDSSGFHSTFELQSLLKETDDHNNETLNLRDSLFSHVDHLKNTSGISGQSDKFLIYDDLEPTDLAKLDASHSSKIINQEKTNKRTVKPETMYLTFLKGKEEENNKYKKMKLELEREKLELKREKLGISKKKLALKEEKLQILKDEKCQDAQYLQRIEKLLEDAHNY